MPDEVLELIPDKLARRLRCVPFRVEGGRLDLAVTDPRNLSAQDEIAFASGKRVKVFVAPEIRILEALEKYYREECPSRFGNVLDRLNRARFLWDKPAPAPAPEITQPVLHSPFVRYPGAAAIRLPPELPALTPSRRPRRRRRRPGLRGSPPPAGERFRAGHRMPPAPPPRRRAGGPTMPRRADARRRWPLRSGRAGAGGSRPDHPQRRRRSRLPCRGHPGLTSP